MPTGAIQRTTQINIGAVQRIFARPLRKDDTHKSKDAEGQQSRDDIYDKARERLTKTSAGGHG